MFDINLLTNPGTLEHDKINPVIIKPIIPHIYKPMPVKEALFEE